LLVRDRSLRQAIPAFAHPNGSPCVNAPGERGRAHSL
jgi:hypothetical protein